MSIATELSNLSDNISAAYDAIQAKGGTVPANKNTDNLTTAITSVPSGGGNNAEVLTEINSGDTATTILKRVPSLNIATSNANLTNLFSGFVALEGTVKLTGGGAVTAAQGVLSGTSVETIDISELAVSGSGVDFGSFAKDTYALTTLLVNHNIKVTNLASFLALGNALASALQNVDLSGWDTSTVSTFYSVFDRRSYLKRVNISGWTNPNTVQTGRMFRYCSRLEELIIDSPSVFNLSADPFSASSIAAGTGYVYVPDNLVSSYQAANYWSTYASQIKGLSELPS